LSWIKPHVPDVLHLVFCVICLEFFKHFLVFVRKGVLPNISISIEAGAGDSAAEGVRGQARVAGGAIRAAGARRLDKVISIATSCTHLVGQDEAEGPRNTATPLF
jgi:hypothetical protein